MQFRVLGPLQVVDDDGSEITASGAKERTLLAALLIEAGEVVSADRLIDILWSENLPANPSNALQARVSALRKSLGRQDVIVNQPPGYRLAVGPLDVDSGVFERKLAEARTAAARSAAMAVDLYDQALSLWRGDPFADFSYQDFARAEISRLEELRAVAREERIGVMLEAGRHAEVLGELEGLVVEYPLREGLWAQLMLALYRSGRQADALRAYRDAARILGEELGIEPTVELRQLEEAILTQDETLTLIPQEVSGERHNLPARLTSLVGRSADTAGVVGLLDDHRLVTLIGPGGVGKTSLALASGEELVARFGDGVWLVELAAVSDPDLVPVEIARSLGLGTGDRSTIEQVSESLRDRELLIILDNCEHLIEAAARAVSQLLQRAPEVRAIATSREPLNVPGEILWPTRPLPVPAEDTATADLDEYDAVRLFLDRARAALPGFVLDASTAPAVSEICRRLDGLPLALELAAARVRGLPVVELAARLDHRFRVLIGASRTLLPRQQTLEATIEWSHDLLDDDEKDLFQRLSVFSGGWTLEAAEVVSPERDQTLDLLTRLVDRSLITVDLSGEVARYSMLETIRVYAAEKLAESGNEKQVALTHAGWFLQLVESARLQGPDQLHWVERLSEEDDNLRVAIAHCLRHGDLETALRLGASLGWWWFFGNREEGRALLDQILEATRQSGNPVRVRALLARVLLDFFNPTPQSLDAAEEALSVALASQDDEAAALSKIYVASSGVFGSEAERSLSLLDDALSTFRRSGDRWGEGFARFQRMEVLAHGGELGPAIEEGEAALACFRDSGDPWGISAALAHLGRYGRMAGRLEWAEEITSEARDLAETRRLPHTVQYVMTDQAYLRMLSGDLEGARRIFGEALGIAVEVGNPVGVATIRNGIGESFLTLGSTEEALRLHNQALDGFEETGLEIGRAYTLARLGLVAEEAEQWETAANHHRMALRTAAGADAVIELIPGLEGLGRVAAALGDLEQAARLLASAGSLRGRSGLVYLPVEETATASAAEYVRTTLGTEALEKAMAEFEQTAPAALIEMADRW
jgi:predicted ATPase/DNA-binding SARP family transcriptional activator